MMEEIGILDIQVLLAVISLILQTMGKKFWEQRPKGCIIQGIMEETGTKGVR